MRFPKIDELLKEVAKQFLSEALLVGVDEDNPETTRYQYLNGTVVYIIRDKETQAIMALSTGDGDSYDFTEVADEDKDVYLAEALISIYTWDILGK